MIDNRGDLINMAIRNVFQHVGKLAESIENVTAEQLLEHIGSDEVLIIDIRELQERVDSGTIPGSVHVPRGMLEFWADPASPYARDFFSEHRRTVLFCASAGRSVYAVKSLEDMGFTNVAQLQDGFSGWKAAGGEIEDTAATSRWVRRPAS